jgi:hypothetical protein
VRWRLIIRTTCSGIDWVRHWQMAVIPKKLLMRIEKL